MVIPEEVTRAGAQVLTSYVDCPTADLVANQIFKAMMKARRAPRDAAVAVVDGRLRLSPAEWAQWLPVFNNDPVELRLALTEASAQIQPNSSRLVTTQARAQLARIARMRKEREARAEKRAAPKKPAKQELPPGKYFITSGNNQTAFDAWEIYFEKRLLDASLPSGERTNARIRLSGMRAHLAILCDQPFPPGVSP